jgi:hypothetical protein
MEQLIKEDVIVKTQIITEKQAKAIEKKAKAVEKQAKASAEKLERKAKALEKKEKAAAEKLEKKIADEMEHSDEYYENIPVSVMLDVTFTHTLTDIRFDILSPEIIKKILKDGRVFSHFIEAWIERKYPIKHISGCKSYDFIDINHTETIYDEKTFTENGCIFYPSNMRGQGRIFDKEVFEKKAKKLIYCIVSNINFPEIKIKFVRGIKLLKLYPNGTISLNDHVKFFN